MAAKKSFKTNLENGNNNPAMAFITISQDQQEQAKTKAVSREEDQRETKSKRLNLLIKPSIFSDISKIAAMNRTSVNEYINAVLLEQVNTNRDKIELYNKTFGDDK